MGEGLRVFLSVFGILVLVVVVVFRLQISNVWGNLSRSFSNDPRKAWLVVFVHSMPLVVIAVIVSKLWIEFLIYGYYLKSFVNNLALADPMSFLLWLLAIIPIVVLVLFRLKVVEKLKTWTAWLKSLYQNNPPAFIISTYGFLWVLRLVLFTGFSWEGELESWWKYFSQTMPTFDTFEVIYTSVAFLLGIFDFVVHFAVNVSIWKRLKECFLPNLVYIGVVTVGKPLEVVLTYVLWSRHMDPLNSTQHFWTLARFMNELFLPTLYFLMAWLLYHWSWFERGKAASNPVLPGWMSEKKYLWSIYIFSVAIYLVNLLKETFWVFWESVGK
jgi:hypothetical protein